MHRVRNATQSREKRKPKLTFKIRLYWPKKPDWLSLPKKPRKLGKYRHDPTKR